MPVLKDGKDYRQPKEPEPTAAELRLEDCEINVTAEFVKTGTIALVTIIVLIWLGHWSAMVVAIGLYVLNFRYAHLLNSRLFQRNLSEAPSSDAKLPPGVPQEFANLDWEEISKLPGVDAERLKETFEYLYRRVGEGTLEVKPDGEWVEMPPSTVAADKKKD